MPCPSAMVPKVTTCAYRKPECVPTSCAPSSTSASRAKWVRVRAQILPKIRGEKPDTHRLWAGMVGHRDPGSREASPVHTILEICETTANYGWVDRESIRQFARARGRSQTPTTADMCPFMSVHYYLDDFTDCCPCRQSSGHPDPLGNIYGRTTW